MSNQIYAITPTESINRNRLETHLLKNDIGCEGLIINFFFKFNGSDDNHECVEINLNLINFPSIKCPFPFNDERMLHITNWFMELINHFQMENEVYLFTYKKEETLNRKGIFVFRGDYLPISPIQKAIYDVRMNPSGVYILEEKGVIQ